MAPCISNGGALEEANGCKFIEHQVTKMDTLAGIAIKYGVEVKCRTFSFSSLDLGIDVAASLFIVCSWSFGN